MLDVNSIEVNNVKKKFKVYYDKGQSLKERLLFRNRNRYEERWVLNGISFSTKKGEAIGIIGQNGCGKSTTLKLLTKIMYPDSGTIQMKGRVSSLIELGAGFHPDMSGRENIYTNASIFGLSKKEIDARLQDIIDFSEMDEYLDNPVRTYSSGMYMRLAFAVAINVDADILLIDEILAVGDSNFQAKCFNKLREIKSQGTTIVIVSHSLGQIEQICDRTLWIQDGRIRKDGTPREVHPEYLDFMGKERQKHLEGLEVEKIEIDNSDIEHHENDNIISEQQLSDIEPNKSDINNSKCQQDDEKQRWGNGHARIKKIRSFNSKGIEQSVFCTGDDIDIYVDYVVNQEVKNATFGIGIFRGDGLSCYGTNTWLDKVQEFDLKRDGTVKILLRNVNFLPGEYLFDIAIQSNISEAIDYYREALKIEIYSHTEDIGVCKIDHHWIIDGIGEV